MFQRILFQSTSVPLITSLHPVSFGAWSLKQRWRRHQGEQLLLLEILELLCGFWRKRRRRRAVSYEQWTLGSSLLVCNTADRHRSCAASSRDHTQLLRCRGHKQELVRPEETTVMTQAELDVFVFIFPLLPSLATFPADVKFALAYTPRSNCFRAQLCPALALLPVLLASPLAAQRPCAPPSPSEPAATPPQSTASWVDRSSASLDPPEADMCSS
jgi:hypothetical protein